MSKKYSWEKRDPASGCLMKIIYAGAALALALLLLAKFSPDALKEIRSALFGKNETERADSVPKPAKTKVVIKTVEKTDTVGPKCRYEIPLEIDERAGAAFLTAELNGVPVRFQLDTGCSGVQITAAEYFYMLHQGAVSENDELEKGLVSIADGSEHEVLSVKIKKLKIGEDSVENVDCSIESNPNAPRLIGQSVLSKLGSVAIDYGNNKLRVE